MTIKPRIELNNHVKLLMRPCHWSKRQTTSVLIYIFFRDPVQSEANYIHWDVSLGKLKRCQSLSMYSVRGLVSAISLRSIYFFHCWTNLEAEISSDLLLNEISGIHLGWYSYNSLTIYLSNSLINHNLYDKADQRWILGLTSISMKIEIPCTIWERIFH